MEDLSIQDINLIEWHSERELAFTPKHFVHPKARLTHESLDWIKNMLVGRYSLQTKIPGDNLTPYVVAFEDPKEATFYELIWS